MNELRSSVFEPAGGDVVLSVTPIEEDQRALQAMLSGWPAPLVTASTLEGALSHLLRTSTAPGHGSTALVLCERDLPDGSWKLLFQRTERLLRPPRFIVSSRLADEYLWVEVLSLGGQDVLQSPYVEAEIRHVVRCAWDAWQRQDAARVTRGVPADDASYPAIQDKARAKASRGLSRGEVA